MARKIARLILTLIGASVGVAVVGGVNELLMLMGLADMSVVLLEWALVLIYAAGAITFGIITYFISPRIMDGFVKIVKHIEARLSEMALSEIVWLITLLANQPLLIHNLQNPQDKRELLTEEAVELLTSPLELSTYKDAIMEAMFKGTKRRIESEDDPAKKPLAG